jgi:hypothetical protein
MRKGKVVLREEGRGLIEAEQESMKEGGSRHSFEVEGG